ncbi:MAG: PP2C family protein-serine/threonine phosphatase [Desulfurivibrio sp.]|nr:PP2C family protein-serine/threonine phosphatase [Desulfurivibrio sp.]
MAELMASMMRPERLSDPHIQFSLEPSDLVSGDMVAINRGKDGRLYLMLADSTGHGLPAALNLLTINYIFYRLSERGKPVSLLVEEMNRAINEHSPADRFVAALVVAIDHRNQVIEVWNGGIPNAMVINEQGESNWLFRSQHLPLGVKGSDYHTVQTEIQQWREPSQLLLWSDGLIDSKNEAGEPLGTQRLISMLPGTNPAQRFQSLLQQPKATRHIPPLDHRTMILVDLPCDDPIST